MSLTAGELVHIAIRRRFDSDLRRHFVGRVVSATESTVRVSGHTFLFNSGRNEWLRRPDRREIVLGLAAGEVLITVLPPGLDPAALRYAPNGERRLVLTDGGDFELDINEFGSSR